MTKVVRAFCAMSLSSASCTTRSLTVSRALVASSKSSTAGSRTMALAMAMRCFCPPLSCIPRSPTCVWKPSGKLAMKPLALAATAASTHCCSEAPPSRP
mmetsp:Transcript_34656/g.62391  ORF Transcript_34656/g.62391 Transcript_34656/m.62391 type:complete len:99 (+) Transcript_34656:1389-1685(+)